MLPVFMQELYKEWDIEQMPPQEVPGIYTVRLDEGVSLTLSSLGQGSEGGIYLSASIGPVGKTQEEAFFAQALLGNLFGQGTKGATLGLDESGNLLTLSQVIDYDVNFKDFRDIVEDFINTLDFWREQSMKSL